MKIPLPAAIMLAALATGWASHAAKAEFRDRIVTLHARSVPGEPEGQGSGVVVDRGLVATACHVVASHMMNRELNVARPTDRAANKPRRIGAQLLAHDYDNDTCLLSIEEHPRWAAKEPVAIAERVRVGQRVLVVGAPKGKFVANAGRILGTPDAERSGKESGGSSARNPHIVSDARSGGGVSGGAWLDPDTNEIFGIHHGSNGIFGRSTKSYSFPASALKRLLGDVDAWRERGRCLAAPTAPCLVWVMLHAAHRVGDPLERTRALTIAGTTQTRTGDGSGAWTTFDAAIEASREIEKPGDRATQLAAVAAGMYAAGYKQAASRLFALSRQVIATIENQDERDRALAQLAVHRARPADSATLLSIVEMLSEPSVFYIHSNMHRDAALGEIAVMLARQDDIAGALNVVERIPDRLDWERFLPGVDASRPGDVGMYGGGSRRTKPLADIAIAQAERNDIAGALRTVQAMQQDSYHRVRALAAIAIQQARTGDLPGAGASVESAARLAERLDSAADDARRSYRLFLQSERIRRMNETRSFDNWWMADNFGLNPTARNDDDDWDRRSQLAYQARRDIIVARAAMGDLAGTVASIEGLKASERTLVYTAIVEVLARPGNTLVTALAIDATQRAFRDLVYGSDGGLLGLLLIPEYVGRIRWESVARIASALARAGQLSEAAEAVRGILDERIAVSVLGDIAIAAMPRHEDRG